MRSRALAPRASAARLLHILLLAAVALGGCKGDPTDPPEGAEPVPGVEVQLDEPPVDRASLYATLAMVDGRPFVLLRNTGLGVPLAGLQVDVLADPGIDLGPAVSGTGLPVFDDDRPDGARQVLMFGLTGETLPAEVDPLVYLPLDVSGLEIGAPATITVRPRVLSDRHGVAIEAAARQTTLVRRAVR